MSLGHEYPRPDTTVHWQTEAACKTRRDLDWFPARGVNITPHREVCAGCPVNAQCLAEALSRGSHEDFGVWGGTGQIERRAIRRKNRTSRSAPQCGTRSGYARHMKWHEPACDECKAANAAYEAARKGQR